MNAGDKWLLEDAHALRLAAVLDHEDLWTDASQYKRLRCPVCLYTFQHVERRQTVPGCDNYEAGWGGRSDLVILPIWGECEHRWRSPATLPQSDRLPGGGVIAIG